METRGRRRLGRYEIVAELGRGAMGVVYKARDPKIDRLVAVKTISLAGQSSDDELEYRHRFFQEAQAAGRLLHPGIVTIFDVGEEPESNDPYIVMEYITGRSLSRMLSGEAKKLPFDTALQLCEELAEGLDYAHAQGVVHRDIKPANIMITDEGHAKIADFGIAKLNLAHLTVPGHVLGTPAYMSPEQLNGDAVDGRSDLFSLGVILYSMVTGYKPFQGNSATTVCFKVANRDPVPATALDSDLPPELDAVIARAIAKDPAQRYQRGSEFALGLRELREHCQRKTTSSSADMSTATGTGHSLIHAAWQTNVAQSAQIERSGQTFVANLHDSVGGANSLVRFLPNRYLVAAGLLIALGFFGLIFKTPSRTITAVERPSGPKPPDTHSPGSLPEGMPNLTSSAAPTRDSSQESSSAALVTNASSGHHSPAPRVRETLNPRQALGNKWSSNDAAGLSIQVQHHFAEAKLSLWIDEKLAYSSSLHGENKKHFVVFRGVKGFESTKLRVPVGQHRLRVHAQSSDDSLDESKAITGTFAKDDEKTLRIDFEKHNREMRLTLQ